jgi:outer membrane immunogenic protein
VGPALFYVTGGFAYGAVKNDISISGAPTVTLSASKAGWTAGAGLETPFTLLGLFGPNWTSKTEYLCVDLGSVNDTFTTLGVTVLHSTSVKEHIFRTGLNYHFNSPVVAKY